MSDIDQLKQCFREAFNLAPDAEPNTMAYDKDPVWDSVGHMRLVAIIETAFKIMFTTEQILDLSSFTKAREIVSTHGISFKS
ncbi:MAG: acyl carrier protein [Alphaproteobacteria bacterium]